MSEQENPKGLTKIDRDNTSWEEHDKILETFSKEDFFRGVRYYMQKFADYVGGIVTDYEVPEANGSSFLLQKNVGSNVELYLLPSGKGQVCLSMDDFVTESPIPVSLIKPLIDNGFNCNLINAIDILPYPYRPVLPLDISKEDDLACHRHWEQIIGVIKQQYKPGQRVFLVGHSSSALTLMRLSKVYPEDITKYVSGLIVMAPKYIPKDPNGGYGSIANTLPVLAMHHKLDKCSFTPAKPHELYFKHMCKSPLSRFVYIEGGTTKDVEDPCWGDTYHSFYQSENKVVDEMTSFINEVLNADQI